MILIFDYFLVPSLAIFNVLYFIIINSLDEFLICEGFQSFYIFIILFLIIEVALNLISNLFLILINFLYY